MGEASVNRSLVTVKRDTELEFEKKNISA